VSEDGDKRRKSRNDQANRRRHDHECRATRLEPDAVPESVREAGVAHYARALRCITDDRAAVWIEMVVTVTSIVMLVIRRELCRSSVGVAVLPLGVQRQDADDAEDADREA